MTADQLKSLNEHYNDIARLESHLKEVKEIKFDDYTKVNVLHGSKSYSMDTRLLPEFIAPEKMIAEYTIKLKARIEELKENFRAIQLTALRSQGVRP